jgi:hypothetical protein
MGVPSTGISTYPKIDKLYAGLGLENRVIRAESPSFGSDLATALRETASASAAATVRRQYATIGERLRSQLDGFHSEMRRTIGR